jgi:hypothetical protein
MQRWKSRLTGSSSTVGSVTRLPCPTKKSSSAAFRRWTALS